MHINKDEAVLIEEGARADNPIFRLELDQRVKRSPEAMTIVECSRQSAAETSHQYLADQTDGEVFLLTLGMLDRCGEQESVDCLMEIARPFFEDGDPLNI